MIQEATQDHTEEIEMMTAAQEVDSTKISEEEIETINTEATDVAEMIQEATQNHTEEIEMTIIKQEEKDLTRTKVFLQKTINQRAKTMGKTNQTNQRQKKLRTISLMGKNINK